MLQAELDAGKTVIREAIEATGYAGWIKDLDYQCELIAYKVLDTAEKVRRSRDIAQRAPVPEVPAGITIIPDK